MGNRHTASHNNTKILPEDIMHYRKSISEVVVQSCATDNWHQMLVSILIVKNITRLSILNSFVPEDSINDTLQLAHLEVLRVGITYANRHISSKFLEVLENMPKLRELGLCNTA